MDLKELEYEINKQSELYEEWNAPIVEAREKAYQSYRKQGKKVSYWYKFPEVMEVYWQQRAKYKPEHAFMPLRDILITMYAESTNEKRVQIRGIVSKNKYITRRLINYIWQCAECIENENDIWIVREGLIAAAIENYTWGDFRDTDWAIAQLGAEAVMAGIDVEPIVEEVLPMCSPYKKGYMTTRFRIERFLETAWHEIRYGT